MQNKLQMHMYMYMYMYMYRYVYMYKKSLRIFACMYAYMKVCMQRCVNLTCTMFCKACWEPTSAAFAATLSAAGDCGAWEAALAVLRRPGLPDVGVIRTRTAGL